MAKMNKIRYRTKKWRDLKPGDVVVLYSFRNPVHYVILGSSLEHTYGSDSIVYNVRKAEDVVIEREVGANPVDEVFVLDPAHRDGVVSRLTKEERWAEIHAEYEQKNQPGNADDESH
ncbi:MULTISPECIES: hypothetical protein [Morganellaceae]|uniref:Uncharacterized protein n=1 Tax=Morganella psychrotolerans TaxID=368603 RepID=A0A1B8HMB7_9GAMM|nr:hypothetical protein [Morganella psychrotolerans]OBU10565.1 hypothetical protein AYY17_15595 [Morganella psychrotolerans]